MSLQVWSDGEDWVLASTKEEALHLIAVNNGYMSMEEFLLEYPEEGVISPLPETDELTMNINEMVSAETHEELAKNGIPVLCGIKVTATVKQWLEKANGPGILMSVNY